MNYWLMKTEPGTFGVKDLEALPKQTTHWDGVRNYQARNFMRDGMRVGDQAFFYHSNCADPGIVAIVEIARAAYPDFTACDKRSPHYDPRSTRDNPVWYMVDVRLKRTLRRVITLKEIKATKALRGTRLVRRGSRLSVMPVTPGEWKTILGMEKS